MKRFLVGLLLSACLHAEDIPAKWHRLHRLAEVSVVLSNGADIASSVGRHELNPVLVAGPFGGRQIGIKIGLAAFPILILETYGRHHAARAFTVGTFAGAGATAAVAVHNEVVR